MYANVLYLYIALGTIGASFGGVLYFEPRLSSGRVKTVICPDGGQCPGEDTCCLLQSMKYGCCPLPSVSAVLCILDTCLAWKLIALSLQQ